LGDLEAKLTQNASLSWSPKSFGYFTPNSNQFGRTSVMPELFRGFAGTILAHWRQDLTSAGHQLLLYGNGGLAGLATHQMPRDFKIGWTGLAFPNEQMNITEIKWQIGDKKYPRLNIEELKAYNKPAIIFEEGLIIDEETDFDFWGYVKEADFQRIIPLGFSVYKFVDRVLGTVGAAII